MKKVHYIVFVLMTLFFWAASWSYYSRNQSDMRPENIIETVQNNIWKRERELNTLLADKVLMTHLWEDDLSNDEFNLLLKKDFIIQMFDSAGLNFVSNNTFVVRTRFFRERMTVVSDSGDVFVYKTVGNANYPGKRMNCIIPIYKYYNVNNDYVRSGFWMSGIKLNGPQIYTDSADWTSGTQIKSIDGQTLFSITIPETSIPPPVPDSTLLILTVLAFFFSMLSVHVAALYITEKKKVIWGTAFFLSVMVTGLLLLHYLPLPFGLENSRLFSPAVFAASEYLPSFGHLIFFVLVLYWTGTFLLDQAGFLNQSKKINMTVSRKSWAIYLLSAVVLVLLVLFIQFLVAGLIFNSIISFDTNKFNAIDGFTLLAIVCVALMAHFVKVVIQLMNFLKRSLIANAKKSYLILLLVAAIVSTIYTLCFHPDDELIPLQDKLLLNGFCILWLLLFCYISSKLNDQFYIRRRGLYVIIFNAVFFSSLFAIYCKYYADRKERYISRIAFAERLSRQQDAELEIKFDEMVTSLSYDSVIVDRLKYGDSLSPEYLHKYFRLKSPELFYTKYAQEICLYDNNGNIVLSDLHTSIDSLNKLRNISSATLSPYLYFHLDSAAQGNYLALLPVKDHTETIGTLGLLFHLKHNISRSAYPALLLSQQEHAELSEAHYDYAIYYRGKLTNQYGNYDFNEHIDSSALTASGDEPVRFVKKQRYSILYYAASPTIIYAVVYENDILNGLLTLFSFLFVAFIILSVFENFVRMSVLHWLEKRKPKPFYNVSMGVRIKYFVLGFTVVSFFIIGLSTVIFLSKRYQSSSIHTIEDNTRNLSDAVAEFLQTQKVRYDTPSSFQHFANTELAYFISTLSRQQKQDINLFSTTGELLYTTQEKVYKYNLMAPYMSPSALRVFDKKRSSVFTHNELIGNLSYLASYAPVYAPDGKLIAFLNVPFFYSKEKLDIHIITLVTTLTNIYTILILISTVITFFFINSLTRSLRLVADSLKHVNLKKNELIDWPYKDEIGLLVQEYNKMVATVEENARSLVLDERQNAWREMAQQVAHEIKNPLTPMKLNIQYLQQAINSNHPDIINLTKRVSSSIIEQIDNLNYIASEFSNFAKMPENKSERIDLKQMLENVVLLFSGNEILTISSNLPPEPVIVFADKSQMLRIFTNIVQNASESIPADRHGNIEISLYQEPDLDHVLVMVSDNGSGIPAELKDKIFDPYFTTKSSGTGLGLAMTKKIIELWGGRIYFESEPNVGTTFYVTLPQK